jgi:hypothetical protein
MFRKADNVFSVILDDETQTAAALPAAGTVITDANLADGAVVLVDIGLRRLNAAAFAALVNGDQFMIVQGKGAGVPLMKTPVMTVGHYTTSLKEHVPAQQQITVIGSTGTANSLPSANDTSYYIKIRKNDNDAANRSQPTDIFGQFKTDGSATQSEVAFGLAGNMIANLDKEALGTNGYILCEVLIDTAAGANTEFGALGTPTGNLAVTNGSKVVTMTATASLAAGDYFRVAGSATEAVTDPVYRIETVDSATQITLDIPYQGDTAAALDDDWVHLIPSATGLADNFGIRLTGIEADFDVARDRNYFVNRFTATFSDEDIVVTHTQGARTGVGTWQQASIDEYMSWGYEGMNDLIAVPAQARDTSVKVPGIGGETALTSKYSSLNVAWDESINTLVTSHSAKGNVLVYLNLEDSGGSGILGTSGSSGEELVTALGLTDTDFDE